MASTIGQLMTRVRATKPRSAWEKGVKKYAMDILENAAQSTSDGKRTELNKNSLRKVCLDGAGSWRQYSNGGMALIYNSDIAKRLCTPSELKKVENGRRNPNSRESWIDVQTRALNQAFMLIERVYK